MVHGLAREGSVFLLAPPSHLPPLALQPVQSQGHSVVGDGLGQIPLEMLQSGTAGVCLPVLPVPGRAAWWKEGTFTPEHWHWQLWNWHSQKIVSPEDTLDSCVPTLLEGICKLKQLPAGAKDFGMEKGLARSKTL